MPESRRILYGHSLLTFMRRVGRSSSWCSRRARVHGPSTTAHAARCSHADALWGMLRTRASHNARVIDCRGTDALFFPFLVSAPVRLVVVALAVVRAVVALAVAVRPVVRVAVARALDLVPLVVLPRATAAVVTVVAGGTTIVTAGTDRRRDTADRIVADTEEIEVATAVTHRDTCHKGENKASSPNHTRMNQHTRMNLIDSIQASAQAWHRNARNFHS
jgi:hypothetical protein